MDLPNGALLCDAETNKPDRAAAELGQVPSVKQNKANQRVLCLILSQGVLCETESGKPDRALPDWIYFMAPSCVEWNRANQEELCLSAGKCYLQSRTEQTRQCCVGALASIFSEAEQSKPEKASIENAPADAQASANGLERRLLRCSMSQNHWATGFQFVPADAQAGANELEQRRQRARP